MTTVGSFLVLGADGMIGGALLRVLRAAGVTAVGTTLRPEGPTADCLQLDLREPPDRWPLPDPITAAFLGAAVTSNQACRSDPRASRLVNVERTVFLARLLRDRGARIVFPSSSLVFGGEIPQQGLEDPVSPRTEYGRQKAEAEREILRLGGQATVVRLTKVVGPRMPLFHRWRVALMQGEVIQPFTDMVLAPIPLGAVVTILRAVTAADLPGILQVSADRDISYADAAGYLAKRLGVAPDLVRPVRAADSGHQPDSITRHTTLDTTRLSQELGVSLPDVWTALDSAMGVDPVHRTAYAADRLVVGELHD